MHSISSSAIKVLTVVIALVLFFVIGGIARGISIESFTTPAYDMVNNVVVKDSIQLVDNFGFVADLKTGKTPVSDFIDWLCTIRLV